MYRAPAGSWGRIARFFLREFPQLYRAAVPFVTLAFLIFAVPAVAGYLVTTANPQTAEALLPAGLTRTVREGQLWVDIPAERRPLVSTTIMTNNIQVSILAFGGGILLGTLSAYVLALNGLLFGTIFGFTQTYGLALDLAAFVSPHGYLELWVVFMAGGAGLQLAWAIITPGLLRRRDALALAARRACLLLVGAIPLLVIAGLIEGFVSPSSLPREVKLAIGPLTGAALFAFLRRAAAG